MSNHNHSTSFGETQFFLILPSCAYFSRLLVFFKKTAVFRQVIFLRQLKLVREKSGKKWFLTKILPPTMLKLLFFTCFFALICLIVSVCQIETIKPYVSHFTFES